MNPRLITLLKRAPEGGLKKIALSADAARKAGGLGAKTLGAAGRGLKAYFGGASRLGGALAEGAGAGGIGQAAAKGTAVLGAAALPFLAAGQIEAGRKAERLLARGVGKAARSGGRAVEGVGRAAQKLVDPYDPYAGQY